ncbi:hypothetical protein INT44_001430 [Umbelopsis vinacea]|uniref:TPR-like protein n=1 Tax=Umbelopsis vinacea TaxID=44442 RepID=A0A8H7UCV4_9FUNG|nr:hypothetical protein INT44_001430 [Umbelopsis vinacea]
MVNYTVVDLLPKIQANIDSLEYDTAYAFCKRALELDNDHVELLEITGLVEVELGDLWNAREHYAKAVQLQPESGFEKYMCLGQLSGELDAIQCFQKGVELMEKQKKTYDPVSQEAITLGNKIASALCSMTEIYLTDCCFEADAEQKCEQYLETAQLADPKSPEVYQMLASVRLSQVRNDEARAALEHSLQLWSDKDPGDPSIPIYDTRLALVKLLLEVQLYAEAFNVLEGLQKENDQSVDLWYLWGWSYYCLGEEQDLPEEERKHHWEDARDCLETAIKIYNATGADDEAMLQHAQELVHNINAVVPAAAEEEEDDGDHDLDIDSDDDAMEL